MKVYWVVEVQLHAFLTSAVGGEEWSASLPGHFTPRERAPGPWYPLDKRLGEPHSRYGCGDERKNFKTLPGFEPPIIQSVAQRYTTFEGNISTFARTDRKNTKPLGQGSW
jgi:hypothetical protein